MAARTIAARTSLHRCHLEVSADHRKAASTGGILSICRIEPVPSVTLYPEAAGKVSLTTKARLSRKRDSLFVLYVLGFYHVPAGSLHEGRDS